MDRAGSTSIDSGFIHDKRNSLSRAAHWNDATAPR
jgi:hypothetical protein